MRAEDETPSHLQLIDGSTDLKRKKGQRQQIWKGESDGFNSVLLVSWNGESIEGLGTD